MRMYNPEWEAIKDFQYVPRCKDAQFELSTGAIPADHGHSLYMELLRHLPWLAETEGVGVHPVHGSPSGRDDNLLINRRVKLVLRLPVTRFDEARLLVGRSIDPGAGRLTIGDLKERPLTPYATLYSHFVAVGTADEVLFIQEARALLDKMGISAGLIPGKKRKMRGPEGEIWGYSLMLHDIGLEHSLVLQEQGLGLHRVYGCGIFIPHKSIKEVVID